MVRPRRVGSSTLRHVTPERRQYVALVSDGVDRYIARSTMWPEEMRALRPLLLRCGLEEDLKWGKPCYSHQGRNIAIMQEMKGFLSLMFFTGALLADPDGLLVEQGPNSRSAKRIELRSLADVERTATAITRLIEEGIEAERSGRSVTPPPSELVLVEELQRRLDEDAALRAAFAALTTGRRREYHLHISGAKQAKTRASRVEDCVPLILAGKGLRDR